MTTFNYEQAFRNIQMATREQGIQTEIISALQHAYGNETSYELDTDGVICIDENKTQYLLCEFKYNEDLMDVRTRSKVILQSTFYLARLEKAGKIKPAVLLVADKNEFFILHTNHLNNYVSRVIDLPGAASTAHNRHPEIIDEMVKDDNLQDRVYVQALEDADDVHNLVWMVSEALQVDRKIRISKYNIHVIFDDFKETVLKNWKELGANKAVNVFMSCLLDPENNDILRRNRDVFMWHNSTKGTDERIEVRGERFDQFWNHFDRENYRISEKQELIQMSDEIIEETNRRFKGEYYTPAVWVEEAHKEMAKVYGENWKEEYVVWDCACGTGNLTRNFRFKELYMSTLNEEDLTQAIYGNENATLFQYDFLNDGDDKLPEDLRKALKDGKVIFLINPPYATSTTLTTPFGADGKIQHKAGVSDHKTHAEMSKLDLGQSKEQLYAHFLFKIAGYKDTNSNIHLGIFSPVSFLTTNSFAKFRNFFLKKMEFKYGMVFQASHFADVSGSWGIGFTIWG